MTANDGYRCKNKSVQRGTCEYAKSEKIIPASSVTTYSNNEAICPGNTDHNKPCGAVLEKVIPQKKLPWMMIALSSATVLVFAVAMWLFLFRGDALLRVDQTSFILSPGQSTKVEVFNDGEVNLQLDNVEFSSDKFSTEITDDNSAIAPGESGYVRVKFSENAQDSIKGSMTIHSNSAGEPVSIEIIGNAKPWRVAEKLNSTSTILVKEKG
ncbi:Ig-like domain-containing protein [Photobacterium leiognathi]|uniref:HYDIN/VesB/CFA65-like Ig-like domain-containing protein n=1 Tax=Photobacterium leiognathi subsp. mandapamensis TaxID=48408 RepID=A0A2T3KZ35_PHOLD|nr:DUF1573 domain-containing protein [Photobacterium leiognathi]PSV13373.1 hypothetical protein C0W93_00035 [Photobacterium leiognathi subsp. mandapamensis]